MSYNSIKNTRMQKGKCYIVKNNGVLPSPEALPSIVRTPHPDWSIPGEQRFGRQRGSLTHQGLSFLVKTRRQGMWPHFPDRKQGLFFTACALLRKDLDLAWGLPVVPSTHRRVRRICANTGNEWATWWVNHLPWAPQATQPHAHLGCQFTHQSDPGQGAQ